VGACELVRGGAGATDRALIEGRLAEKTLEELGAELGVTREAVRKREEKAIARLFGPDAKPERRASPETKAPRAERRATAEKRRRRHEEADAFRRAFAAAPDIFTADERAIAEAMLFEGSTIRAAAARLGLSYESAAYRRDSGRLKLRTCLNTSSVAA
jgi:sigma-70-like protein